MISRSIESSAARRTMASSRGNRALAEGERGDVATAFTLHTQAMKDVHELLNDDTSIENQYCLGTIAMNFGGFCVSQKKLDFAEAPLTEAIATFSRLCESHSSDTQIREWLAISQGNLAVLYIRTKRPVDAKNALQEQIRILAELTRDYPTTPDYRHEMAVGRGNLASLLRSSGSMKDAQAELVLAISALRGLVDDFPDVIAYREHLAAFEVNQGNQQMAVGAFQEAVESYGHSYDEYKCVDARVPGRKDVQAAIADVLAKLGLAHHRNSEFEASEIRYREAIQGYRQLTLETSDGQKWRYATACILWQLGNDLLARNQQSQGENALRESLDLLEDICANAPDELSLKSQLVEQHRAFASKLSEQPDACGRSAEIIGAYNRSEELALMLISRSPESKTYRDFLDAVRVEFAETLSLLDQETEAWRVYQDALREHPNCDLHQSASWFLSTCSDLALRDPRAALEYAEKAVAMSPDDFSAMTILALAQYRVGNLSAARECFDKASNVDGSEDIRRCVVGALITAKAQAVADSQRYVKTAEDIIEKESRRQTKAILGLLREVKADLEVSSDAGHVEIP